MRAVTPLPGDPWPPDMLITVDCAQPLLELLWVRAAWGLQPAGDGPPPLTHPPARRADTPPAEWEAAWPPLWDACVAHAAHGPDPALINRLRDPGLAPVERAASLQRLIGPSWRDRFGDAALAAPAADGYSAEVDRQTCRDHAPLAESPERRSLPALAAAWRVGLTRVVTIPCVGEHTRVIGASGLLVTDGTRADPARYTAALDAFAAHAA